MPYSNLSVVIPNEAVAAIYAAIATIKTNLPFLINLTNDEKMAMIKMGEGSIQFVSKALAYGKSTPSIVPPYTDLNELGRDLAATSVMLPIAAEIDKLATAVSDTTIALGNEAMAASLSIYNTTKYATKANVPGVKSIYDDLRTRFPGRPPKDDSITNTNATTPAK